MCYPTHDHIFFSRRLNKSLNLINGNILRKQSQTVVAHIWWTIVEAEDTVSASFHTHLEQLFVLLGSIDSTCLYYN